MRRIGVVTGNRSEYGILRPVLRGLAASAQVDLQLYVTGAHLSPTFGSTVEEIRTDGFCITAEIDCTLAGDSPCATAKTMALAQLGLAQVYQRERPDLLLVLGDRYEILAAVVAATPFRIPVAHIHGGEVTEGAVDEGMRHAITKLSHLHFASTERYAQRLRQLGEEPWRITVSGAPGLDNLNGFEPRPRIDLEQKYGLPLTPPPLLVTYHATSDNHRQLDNELDVLFSALNASCQPVVFTYPNPDPGGRYVASRIREYVANRQDAWLVKSLGTRDYFSLMSDVAAMIGNSSSGIIEAASFHLPVVNIGNRQAGRVRGANVIDVPASQDAVTTAISRAQSPAFRDSLRGLTNPYGDGSATERIVTVLARTQLNDRLLTKRFCDLDSGLSHSGRDCCPGRSAERTVTASPLRHQS